MRYADLQDVFQSGTVIKILRLTETWIMLVTVAVDAMMSDY